MKTDLIAVRENCRVCGHAPLVSLLSLGDLYVSDFVDDGGENARFPLELVLCNATSGGCGLLQLKHTVSHEGMYRNYWYRSGMNQTMTEELQGIAATIQRIVPMGSGDYVIDIGANDGTLLRSYTIEGLQRTGFEPAKNLAQYNSAGGNQVIGDFFNYQKWKERFGGGQAKAVTAIAMFYDLEDPNSFIADVATALHDEGVFIIQMSYLPLMLSQNAFDNICHEHVEYYSLFSLENLLKRHDLEVFDVELNDVNGGSFRTYIRHKGRGASLRIAPGAEGRVAALRAEEEALGLNDRPIYDAFVARVMDIKEKLTAFIREEVAHGKKIYVYGASTKGNTLLQFFGLDHTLIAGAAERNPDKWGKKTVGTLIPIVSEQEARDAKPDYFLILPWHFLKEFRERERAFFERGGKFIVPMPNFEIIDRA